jgi:hypothetical protein
MAAGRASDCAADFLADLMAANLAAGVTPRREAPEKGQTLPSRHGQPEPRLPHERDESSDSHPGTADERVEQAARDLADGQQDTGRTPVVTELARKEFPPHVENKPTP